MSNLSGTGKVLVNQCYILIKYISKGPNPSILHRIRVQQGGRTFTVNMRRTPVAQHKASLQTAIRTPILASYQ